MLSLGGVHLRAPNAEDVAFIASRIPIHEAFGWMRPRWFGDQDLNPRIHFNWFLSRPLKLNCFFHPWGASRWGYAFVLADRKMYEAITAQNTAGQSLTFTMDDELGGIIHTQLYQLPAIPLSKINESPALPLYLLPLVDERHRWWERAANITMVEGTTTWAQLYATIATAIGITLAVDPVDSAYLKPGSILAKQYQPLPLLLDWVAASVGQRVVRRLNSTFAAINPATAQALMISQANAYKKYAGGSLNLGIVNA